MVKLNKLDQTNTEKNPQKTTAKNTKLLIFGHKSKNTNVVFLHQSFI